RSVDADVPEELARVVDRALALDIGERWESAHAMQEALRGAMRKLDAAWVSGRGNARVAAADSWQTSTKVMADRPPSAAIRAAGAAAAARQGAGGAAGGGFAGGGGGGG